MAEGANNGFLLHTEQARQIYGGRRVVMASISIVKAGEVVGCSGRMEPVRRQRLHDGRAGEAGWREGGSSMAGRVTRVPIA